MGIDPRQCDDEADIVTENAAKPFSSSSSTLQLPPSPHRSPAQGTEKPMLQQQQQQHQPQGDLVTLLRYEYSPVLISGHINFTTSYILLRDHPCSTSD
ncbi:Hypothetical predicted protein [Scomber scombrus]|uniref:Uncharacterized protein n=1 Tax=Scomber scombrus TaxID=13677 RepID=A0AAV1NNV9_SCOSC